MSRDVLSTIDAPESTTSSKKKDDVVIHVMPAEFYGRKETPKPKLTPAHVPLPVTPAPKPLPKPVAMKKRTKKRRLHPALLVLGPLFLVSLVLAGYFVLQTLPEDLPLVVDIPDEPLPPDVVPPLAPPPVKTIQRGIDTDSDGLTDREEALYGTDFRSPDTDGDTFLDGNEVFHRYDPLGYSPSTLLDTGSVAEFSRADIGYSLLYPVRWKPLVDEDTVHFESGTSAVISLKVEEKPPSNSFEIWYRSDVRDLSFSELSESLTKEGYASYVDNDNFISYLDTGEFVLVFDYDVGEDYTVDYLQTFHMMLNSVVFEAQVN
jgi:hypothetical protein